MKIAFFALILLLTHLGVSAQTDFPLDTVLQKGHTDYVRAYDFSPDNQFIATGGFDNVVLFWDLKSGKQIRTYSVHTERIRTVEFSLDQKSILTLGADNKVKVFEVETGQQLLSVDVQNNDLYKAYYSATGRYFYAIDNRDEVYIWEIATGNEVASLKSEYSAHNEPALIHLDEDKALSVNGYEGAVVLSMATDDTLLSIPFDKVHSMSFSPNGENMVTCSWDGNVKVWNLLTGMLVGKMDLHQGDAYAIKYDPKSRFVASGGADNQIVLWDPETNKVVSKLIGHSSSVTSIDITTNGQFLISMSVDGLMKVWDLNTFKEVFSRIQMSKDEWLATNPSGYFHGSYNALQWVNYVKGNQVVNVSNLFEKYYTPGLIGRIHNEDKGLNDRSGLLESQMSDLPELVVAIGGGGKRSVVVDRDSVFTSATITIPLEISIGEHETPLDEIRIYNNGKLVIQESLEENITFRGGSKNKRLYEVPLSNGLNELTSIVVNSERTESEPTTVIVEYNGELAKTDLYILSIGINSYKNPAYNLDYAVNDSKAIVKSLEDGADSLFNSVKTYSLLNSKATKANILETIAEIKGEIGSEDVFMFYYAGLGVMSNEVAPKEPEFFIVTHDVTNLYYTPEVIREKAIFASDLMQISKNIIAEKQLFILDACHSGGAIESFAVRGSEREKALAQLARNTGTFFLTAAQDAEFANEVGELNHGLFTYALLEVLQGTVSIDGDTKITVSELKAYVEERVPELSEEYHGSPQYPTGYSFGRDFPIVILK